MEKAYQVIARRWRPSQFNELVGQDHIVRTLSNAIDSKRIANPRWRSHHDTFIVPYVESADVVWFDWQRAFYFIVGFWIDGAADSYAVG